MKTRQIANSQKIFHGKILTALSLLFVLTAACLLLCCVFVFAKSDVTWSELDIEQTYKQGSSFTAPTCELKIDNETFSVRPTLRFPNGSETSAEQVTLDEGGIYTLRYTFEHNGEVFLREENFTVNLSYAAAGEQSETEYVSLEGLNSFLAQGNYTNALRVGLKKGEILRFAQPIDLSDVTSSDVLIEFKILPEVTGIPDFEAITVTFTDAEDPEIFFKVYMHAYGGSINNYRVYTLAAANGQVLEGYYHNRSSGQDLLDLKVNDSGTSTASCFHGNSAWKDSLRISYDAATKQVFINTSYIIDFDSAACYPDSMWDGFKSDKVFVSVEGGSYSMDVGTFYVYGVYGMDLSQQYFYDVDAPKITVDTIYDEMPISETGSYYAIPTATATDEISGSVPVTTNVYFGYNSSSPQLVKTEADGTFLTDRAGYYAIVYTASDYFGNQSEQILWVQCLENADSPVVTISSEKQTAATLGAYVEIASATVGGGSGQSTLQCFVSVDGQSVDVVDNRFLPEKAGEYLVTFVATDYIGQRGYAQYAVTATASENPVFANEAVLPAVYIDGSTYTIPEFIAYDYSGGAKQQIVATCSVTDGNGKKEYRVGDAFSPKASDGAISLTFVAGATEKTYSVPCVEVWTSENNRKYLNFEKFFYGANITSVNTRSGVELSTETDASVTFANCLYPNMFQLQFKCVADQANFDGLKLTLTDSCDSAKTICLSLNIGETSGTFDVGGVTKSVDFGKSGGSSLTISYTDGVLSVGGMQVSLTRWENGKDFDGFSSKGLWVDLAFVGVNGSSAVLVEKIGNQLFGSLRSDNISPEIYLTHDAGGVVDAGQTILIPACFACDALDPNIQFTYSVVDENNNPLTDTNGVLLSDADPTVDRYISLEEIGQVYVKFVAKDTFGNNRKTYQYAFTVEDSEAPTLTFSSQPKENYVVGDIFVIPNYTLSDNATATENIVVAKYYIDPNGVMYSMPSNSNSVKMTAEGKYQVIVMAVDEVGNIGYKSFVVYVTEGDAQ